MIFLHVLCLCVFPNFRYSSKCFAQIYRVQYRAAILVQLFIPPTQCSLLKQERELDHYVPSGAKGGYNGAADQIYDLSYIFICINVLSNSYRRLSQNTRDFYHVSLIFLYIESNHTDKVAKFVAYSSFLRLTENS